jgi:hypothetical protein
VAVGAVLEERRTQIMKRERRGIALPRAAEAGRAVVALQAHREYHRPAEQPRVRRAVRRVAGLAAFHAHWRVLEHERPAFFFVALEARFFVGERLLHHVRPLGIAPRRLERSVRIVAIGAHHNALVDAVLKGHGELGSNVGVTAVTHLGLCAGQQKFCGRGFVNRVAAGANHAIFGVRRVADVRPCQRFAVTAQAIVQNLFRLQLRKGNDGGLSAARFNVRTSGTVAALAPSVLGGLLTGGDALEMRILVELQPDVGMAGLTSVTSDEAVSVVFWEAFFLCESQRRRTDQHDNSCAQNRRRGESREQPVVDLRKHSLKHSFWVLFYMHGADICPCR